MTYGKKLLVAKILVSLGLCMYVLIPFAVDFGVSHIDPEHWTPHARFHLTWVLYGNLMALPVMLWAIWGKKLHGTGRSVRLMAYLGMAFTMGFYVAVAFRARIGAELHDPDHEHLVMGAYGNLVSTGIVFILLLSGVFISIRRGSDT
ncbi:MAG: hypothetical protein COB92_05685 [Robiginitomaculum sp.]|nr:MAG: hypothetical protein COB92_05685 [Robiginitomaculum sp.]